MIQLHVFIINMTKQSHLFSLVLHKASAGGPEKACNNPICVVTLFLLFFLRSFSSFKDAGMQYSFVTFRQSQTSCLTLVSNVMLSQRVSNRIVKYQYLHPAEKKDKRILQTVSF